MQTRSRITLVAICLLLASLRLTSTSAAETYFPPPETAVDWRSLVPANQTPDAAQTRAVMDETGLDWHKLHSAWQFVQSFGGTNSLLVIRNGWIAAEWDDLKRPFPVHSCTK